MSNHLTNFPTCQRPILTVNQRQSTYSIDHEPTDWLVIALSFSILADIFTIV